MPHSNQDIQANIESYHGALKHWFAFDTKGLRRHKINWSVWQLTTAIAHYYMHTLEMKKKKRFHKKQGYGGHCYMKCRKGSLYSIHPCVLTKPLESDGAWGIWNQRFPNIIYVVKFPFTKISCCTCEWALRRKMCKHQIVIIFTCTDIS